MEHNKFEKLILEKADEIRAAIGKDTDNGFLIFGVSQLHNGSEPMNYTTISLQGQLGLLANGMISAAGNEEVKTIMEAAERMLKDNYSEVDE